MPTNPFKQLCLDSITGHRATLDQMEQVVQSLPDNWSGNSSASTAGGGRGAGTTTPKKPANRHRSRTRAGGGRGPALQTSRL